MLHPAVKTGGVVGIAAVAAFGMQHVSAAHDAGLNAQPQIQPLRNIDYQYSTDTTGGTGDEIFDIPNPPNGLYQLSYTANFSPAGSPDAPVQFSCSLIKNGTTLRAEDTTLTASGSGFYAGVNGSNVIKIDRVAQFQMFCGTADGSDWTWGTRPVQVNLMRIDGLQTGQLPHGALKQRGQLPVDGRGNGGDARIVTAP